MTMSPSTARQERERGKALRSTHPRRAHGTLRLRDDRDLLLILKQQHKTRLRELIPVRIGRMLQSPFALYRGTAAQMAYDLSGDAATDLRVVSCGDAHISNFGLFASPERTMLLDLNDFDEGGIAPFEWDVKRLAASVHIGGRNIGLSEQQCSAATERAVAEYQSALREFMEMTALERFYYQIDTAAVEALLTNSDDLSRARKLFKRARRSTADQVLSKITTREACGTLRIRDEPPVTRHVKSPSMEEVRKAFDKYRSTLRDDVRVLLGHFEIFDFVLRVVGVGSVGTRCYVIGLLGPDGEPLFLQAKEAQPSVLTTYGGMPAVLSSDSAMTISSEGQRVVFVQRILQAQSDPFLGWYVGQGRNWNERPHHHYYWRQFRDMKGSVNLSAVNARTFGLYTVLCARLLARAHSQSRAAHAVTGYVGQSGRFAESIAAFAAAYADVCEADFERLETAVAAGKLPAERGV